MRQTWPVSGFTGLLLLIVTSGAWAADYRISPGDDPQQALDAAAPGDKLIFLPGVHRHPLGRHRAMLYVEKSIHLELQEGATLQLADNVCRREAVGEITTDQDATQGKLDDLEVGGVFDVKRPPDEGAELYGATVYTVIIERQGQGSEPDTFRWGDGKLFDTPHRQVAITGDWQELSHGVKIRFASRSGHAAGSLWFISYDGPEAYGIRIGHGLQKDYIEGVTISGQGTIDLNLGRNAQPSGLVKNINACVLIHGRVRDVRVEGITMTNTMRSVMCYGEHTGKMLPGGATEGGESFDAENILIERTRTLNPAGAAYLLGHPSHRGRLRNVQCNNNYMETGLTAIEPNFNLDGYEVIGNVIKSNGQAIHCWRHSTKGVVADNLRVHDITGKPVVVVNSPRGWQVPDPPIQRNNRNHLRDLEIKSQKVASIEPFVELQSGPLTPGLRLDESPRPVHQIRFLVDASMKRGMLILDSNQPEFDQFGELVGGLQTPHVRGLGKPNLIVEIACTIELEREAADSWRLYRIQGSQLRTPVRMATRGAIVDGGPARLVVLGPDGQAESVIACTRYGLVVP